MNTEATPSGGPLSAAACAILVATSVGAGLLSGAGEAQALDRIDRYCAASWRNARIARQDWEDCTQQVFVEMLDRVARDRWIEAIEDARSEERRQLNRSIWATIQRWRRLPRFGQLRVDAVADPIGAKKRSTLPTLDELREAVASGRIGLTSRQQKILTSWLDGSSIAQIAADLKLPPSRVSDEKYKALEKLRRRMPGELV